MFTIFAFTSACYIVIGIQVLNYYQKGKNSGQERKRNKRSQPVSALNNDFSNSNRGSYGVEMTKSKLKDEEYDDEIIIDSTDTSGAHL